MSTSTVAATGPITSIAPFTVRFPHRQLFNNIQWTRLADLQRILNKDVQTYRTAKDVLADLNRLRAFITPPPVKDGSGKDVLIDSIYSCRETAVSTRRVQITARETTLGNEIKGTDSTGVERTFPARQCTFVRTPQTGGQITFLPTATLRSTTPNLAVLLFTLQRVRGTIDPATYQGYIDENLKRKAQQQQLIDTIDQRLEALKEAERARLQAGIKAIDDVIATLGADRTKLTETFGGFQTALGNLQAIYDAALAKDAELEGRYNELSSMEGDGMFGGARRRSGGRRKQTRKLRRVMRKRTRRSH